jgi:hypothetical protein
MEQRHNCPQSLWVAQNLAFRLQGLGLAISCPASMTPSSVPQGRQVDADTKAGRKGKELDELVPETAKGKPELVGGVQTPLGFLFAPLLGGPCPG